MYEWFIARRYLRAKHKTGFISLITFISVAGITVGVIALIIVLSVYAGFTTTLRDQILGTNSHIIVQSYQGVISNYEFIREQTLTTDNVIGATPYLYSQTLVSSARGGSGVVLRGLDPQTAGSVINLPSVMINGSVTSLDQPEDTAAPNIIIGKDLAQTLKVQMGSKIRIISPSGPLTPMGIIPKIKTCRVSGIFETGMYEYDSSIAYINIKQMQTFMGLGKVAHGIEVKIAAKELDHADIISENIEKKLGEKVFVAKDWMQMNSNLFAAFKLEKIGMFIAVALIILVAALNIVSALVMVVMEKREDIAILKSMGATARSIMKIFFFQGAVIGICGTVAGVFLGVGICKLLARYQFIELPSNVYPMNTLPMKVLPMDVGIIAFASISITLLATLYPSWKAAQVSPAEVL